MNKHTNAESPIALRPPAQVMRLSRMGSFHQTRLSFMRSLLRRLKRENWSFTRPIWRLDKQGVGVAVYVANGPERCYSLVCFSHDLNPEKRSDRAIATEWDATFTLYDGIPDEDDLVRLSAQVPKQEAGRVSDTEFILSRANRSVRLFSYVVDQLAAGLQPDQDRLDAIGYLMRTTAVYGSGKFGAASRDKIQERPEVSQPFHIEMLGVYLIRQFTIDIVEHLARSQSPQNATTLAPELRRRIGVGNSTGLGMAPFLVTHPVLLNNWIAAREKALYRVRSLARITPRQFDMFKELLATSMVDCQLWNTTDARQAARIEGLKDDLEQLSQHLDTIQQTQDHPWNAIYQWASDTLDTEAQELVVSLLIEVHGDLVDDLCESMSADEQEHFTIDGATSVGELHQAIKDTYDWALEMDFTKAQAQHKYWYVSENKLEPRVGERAMLASAGDREMPITIGRDIHALIKDILAVPQDQSIADFLLHHPEHRHCVRRVQIARQFPYSEIRDNLIDAESLPLDMLRCKLSFFGATRFDPKSDLWTRITMFQHAPVPTELASADADRWVYATGVTAL